MDLAWQAADLAIGRSGAGTLAEALLFEVPMILIPYPHATDNHQEHNADFMVDLIGGAQKLCEKELTAERLASTLTALWHHRAEKLSQMRQALRLYKATYPQQKLSDLIMSVLEKSR
jgi:UDP-N-acetylglucosamine--N-acetylmuramyl-(pentapeptide) pyrophosphoryl-undecaprenol N-acetylglucosamine transferase